jgi:hypothetical protein
MRRAMRFAVAGLMAASLLGGTQVAAHAQGGGGVENSGPCSATSDWKLKAKPDNGNIEVEFEVDSNVVGQTWQFRIKDNGTVIASGQRTTQAPSGSFAVRKITADLAGTDHFVGQARNPATGETCRGTVSL